MRIHRDQTISRPQGDDRLGNVRRKRHHALRARHHANRTAAIVADGLRGT
jgi:hypothetical protein